MSASTISQISSRSTQTRRLFSNPNSSPFHSRPPLGVNTTLKGQRDTYFLKQVIGSGIQGQVFLAWAQGAQKHVAVKTSCSLESDFDLGEERDFIARFEDPRIVTYEDGGRAVSQGNDYFYFAVEYVEGVTLKALLQDGPLPLPRALEIMHQVCYGLDYLHQKSRVVHGDLKPSNVIISQEDEVKLIDFGLACPINGFARGGTFGFRSPEQAAADRLTPQSDIFSLGLMFYFMLNPTYFQGDRRYKINMVEKQPLPPVPAGYPGRLNNILAIMTQFDPALRYQDCETLQRDLQQL